LLLRFGTPGEMVLLSPSIRALAARYGSPVDIVAVGADSAAVLEGQPGVGDICVIGRHLQPYWVSYSQRKLVRRLAARQAGPVWDCDASDKSQWLLARAGVDAEMIALGSDCPRRDGEHHLDRWLRFVHATPASGEPGDVDAMRSVPPYASIEVAQSWRDELDQWLAERGLKGRPLVLLQASRRRMPRGSRIGRSRGGPPEAMEKPWPIDRWAEVVRMLRERERNAMVVLTGAPTDREFNDAILAAAGYEQSVNAANDLPITKMIALQERAIGMISVDADPAWTAAAVGCPVLVLYGVNDPKVHEPRGPKPNVETLTGEHEGVRSILGIRPRNVEEAWNKLRAMDEET
jgi:ADP-heptose:LPS heptosyltransferase